jgi:hypothetical protein
MHKVVLILFVSLLWPIAMWSQQQTQPVAMWSHYEAPRVGLFGGYSYLRNGGNSSTGWDGQATFNFNRYLGITADLGSDSRTLASFSPLPFLTASANDRFRTLLLGPTVTAHLGRSAVFAHALFGVARASLGAGISVPIAGGLSTDLTNATAFAMAFGGGVDIGVTRHFAIRAAQVDYIRTRFNSPDVLSSSLFSFIGPRQNSFRYSAGIVFRF